MKVKFFILLLFFPLILSTISLFSSLLTSSSSLVLQRANSWTWVCNLCAHICSKGRKKKEIGEPHLLCSMYPSFAPESALYIGVYMCCKQLYLGTMSLSLYLNWESLGVTTRMHFEDESGCEVGNNLVRSMGMFNKKWKDTFIFIHQKMIYLSVCLFLYFVLS